MIDSYWSKDLSSFNTRSVNVCPGQSVRDFLSSLETQLEILDSGQSFEQQIRSCKYTSPISGLTGPLPLEYQSAAWCLTHLNESLNY